MPMRQVQLTDALDRFIEERVETGRYQDASDVMRESLRLLEMEEREHEAKITALRLAISEGRASGVFEGDPFAQAWSDAGLAEADR